MNDASLFTPEKPAMPKEYEILRDMDAFTEEMFNRIVAFQEKLHPAWNMDLSFDERIKDLTLHCMIFSNPDRDPAVNGPSIAPFYPMHAEIQQLAHCIKQVASKPIVCDLHAGNGFVGSLLAREGVKVIGLRDPAAKPNQIRDFYDASCYQIKESTIDSIDFEFDVALSSWMPAGVNLTPDIIKYKPKLIIFMHTDHIDESTGIPQTGTVEAFRNLPKNYALIGEWSIVRPQDLLHEIWADLSPNIEETRQVKVYADEPFHNINIDASLPAADPYDWEQDLEIALTALQAKQDLRDKGFPV